MALKYFLLTICLMSSLATAAPLAKATFAGGCFWCMEAPFEKLVGVKSVISGFSGGTEKNPRYVDVASGKTGHREVVQITYNPKLVSYERLLEIFWQNINPMDDKGQFVDRGVQYAPAIFFHDERQKKLALKSKDLLDDLNKFKKPITTPILEFKKFYPAEDEHQDYYRKNLITKAKYKYYRNASGRDEFLTKYWKKEIIFFSKAKYKIESKQKLKTTLSKLAYEVTQEEATEPPFKNQFWDNKKSGIYVDIVSGEPLFSSKDKFKSGTGWPSFTKPLNSFFIVEKMDEKLLSSRIEVRSRVANSHLGHVFKDGPEPLGLRYCINSAALRFIAIEHLEKNGFGEYLELFR